MHIHTHAHTLTHIHACIHTCTHIYTHTRRLQLDTITTEDVLAACASTKPSARTLQGKYKAWQAEFESV